MAADDQERTSMKYKKAVAVAFVAATLESVLAGNGQPE